jgi:hypothetical protein
MSTGTNARWARSTLAIRSVLLAFAAIYASIVVFSFAAVWTLEPRLPVEARSFASYWLMSELVAISMYLAWIALPRPHRMQHALEVVLPIGLCPFGVDAAGLTATLWFNLDETAFRSPFGSLLGLGLLAFGAFGGWLLGRHLGDRAASSRLRREAASNRRSAWFAETSPDASWRRATGITIGLLMLPLIVLAQATSSAYAPGSALPLQLLAAGAWALAVFVGDRTTISITDAAVKVRNRTLSSSNVGWSVSLSEVESRCVLRSGPALEIRTVTGGRYVVSLDDAGEAVAVIEALRSDAPPGTRGLDVPLS